MATGSFWHTTCTALRAGREPGWEAVADYRSPLSLVLAARYRWLSAEDREDLVQDILIAIKERLHRGYRPDRGPFRAYLTGVVRNKVLDRWRKQGREAPLEAAPEPEAVTEAEGAAVDLVAATLGALRRWHEEAVRRPTSHRTAIYVVGAVLAEGESYRAVAEREGLSKDAVYRIMSAFRDEMLADVLKQTLGVGGPERALLDWTRLARLVQRIQAAGGGGLELLEEVAHRPIRQALELWIEDFRLAQQGVAGQTVEGEDLRRGLQAIFGP